MPPHRVAPGLLSLLLTTVACRGAGERVTTEADGGRLGTSEPAASANPRPDPPCALDPARDGPWYPSVASFEHFDSGRTHTFRCARFGGRIDGTNTARVAAVLPDRYPTPYNLVHRERGEAFVYGGAYGDVPGAPGSFVARVDTTTNAQVWRTQLVDAAADPSAWNYPGVVGVHRDGMVYVIYGTKLSKLDPVDGRVVATVELPALGSRLFRVSSGT